MRNSFGIRAAIVLSVFTCLFSSLSAQTIDLTKPVGTPKGVGTQNGSGGITYTIPIETTPGINGLMPAVNLVYNSQSGDGNFGYGWSLSAYSMITRAGKTNYYNGINAPISWTNTNDAFVLDGQRLFATSGTYGASGTTYGTENENFTKIVSYGGYDPHGPQYFVVTLKNGTILEYGNASDALMIADNGMSNNMIWFLNKITDINGNYETFHWGINPTDRDYALGEIDYTGNTALGITPKDKIVFTYTVKANWQTTKQYQAGASMCSPFLLSTIKIWHDIDNPVKTYTCGYTNLHNQYYLTSFTETSGVNNTSFNPLTFTYGSNPTAADVSISPSYGNFVNANNVYTGDITGDGMQDLIAAYYTIDNNGWQHFTEYDVFDGLSSYGGQPALSLAYQYPFTQTTAQIKGSTNYYNFVTFDYDGDSKQDVLMANWNTSGTDLIFTGVTINYSRYYSAVSGQTYKTVQYTNIPHVSSYVQNFVYPYKGGTNFIPGDFDGDGVQDYILILGINSTNAFKAFFSSPKKGIFNQEIAAFGVEGTATDPFYANSVASTPDVIPIDFNGDGKTELLISKANQSYVMSIAPLSAATGYNWGASILYTTTAIKSGYRIFPGDFNGDGNTDLLVRSSPNQPSAAWNMYYSSGTSYIGYSFIFSRTPYLDHDAGGYVNMHLLMIADLNGDGKSDIWHSLDESSTLSSHYMYYSSGTTIPGQTANTSFQVESYSQPLSIDKNVNAATVFGDFNGDGKTDLLSLNGSNTRIIYPKPFKEDRLMVKSTDGLGNATTYGYGLISNNSSLYQRSVNYDYDNPNQSPGSQTNGNPYAVIRSPLYALSTITSPNGIGGTSTLAYSYQDAALSPVRGFLGFKQLAESDYNTGFVQTKISDIDPTLLVPHLIQQTTTYGSTRLSDSKVTDVLASVNPGNYFDKRYTYRISQTNDYSDLTGAATQSVNTYDAYNNITTNVSSKGYLNGTSFTAAESTTTTTVFGTHGTPVPAVPESITISSTRSGQSAVSKVNTFTYDSKGNVATSVTNAGTPIATTATNTYDGFGNVINTVYSAPSTLTPSISYTYDASGRFLTQRQTVGSSITKTEKYTYDDIFGLLASTTASDGLVTGFTYDAFGRLNRTNLPDGNAITQTVAWETSGARYSNVSQRVADNGLYHKSYFDVLDREVKTEATGLNGAIVTATAAFNTKGQLISKTEPHYASETVVTTSNTYDVYGRLSTSGNGTSSITMSYSTAAGGLYTSTSTNAAGQASSVRQDGAGRTVAVTDNGGTVNFTYDSWGNKTAASLGGNTLVSCVYDAYNRQTSLTDKNAGTYSYGYNAAGKLTSQTDANGHQSTVTYDAFGRVLTKSNIEATTNFTYYNDPGTGKCNDQLTQVTGYSGDITTYGYDNLRRLTTESVAYDGNTFTKTLAYDIYGNLIQTTYPSGVIINDTYDKNGILTATTMGSGTVTPLFNATAMNGRGVYTGYTYGNGKSSTVTYDPAKGVPSRYYTAGVQDLNLNFDGPTGNLLSRNDAIKGVTETFTYDNLNRLATSKVGTLAQIGLTYDNSSGTSLGNIKTKSDVGNYTYKTDKLNATAFITSTAGGTTPPGVIPQAQQDIAYNALPKAATLQENGYSLIYNYGGDEQRIKSKFILGNPSGSVQETKYYIGAFERQNITAGSVSRDIHYVKAGNGICAIIVKQGTTVTPYYVYYDHLGSLLTVTDASGNVVASQNYDAWGRNRNPNDWTYAGVPAAPQWLYRGFTGHEQLSQISLINMNGRMYDPTNGQMASPDNFVAYPNGTQGYNRYSYAGNNPTLYIDRNGQWFGLDDLIVAAVGFVVGYVSYGITSGNWGWKALAAGGITAAAGWLGYNTAGAATSLLTKAGLTSGLSTVIGSGVGGAVASAFGSASSQLYFNGTIDWSSVGKSSLYGFASGIGSGAFDQLGLFTKHFPMSHTVKYLLRSTAGELTGGLVKGDWSDMDFGFNPGLILPVASDVVSMTSPLYASKIANKMAKARLDEYKDKITMKYNVNIGAGVDYGAYPDFDNGGRYILLDPANDKYLYDPVGLYAQVELTGGFEINKIGNIEITGLKFPDLSGIKFNLPLLKLPFTMSSSMNFSSIYTNLYRYGRK